MGLQKDEIPILSRIVSVADYFDAMTYDRCYSKGRSIQEAIEIRNKADLQTQLGNASEAIKLLDIAKERFEKRYKFS